MESALYGIYALFVFVSNLTRSLRSLVRFLIRQQLVRKYRTPALSMKYSLYKLKFINCNINLQRRRKFRTRSSNYRKQLEMSFLFPLKRLNRN